MPNESIDIMPQYKALDLKTQSWRIVTAAFWYNGKIYKLILDGCDERTLRDIEMFRVSENPTLPVGEKEPPMPVEEDEGGGE